MKVFVDFQEKLSQTAIFSIRESDFAKHYNGKNGKLLVNLMNYPDKIVISSIFDVFPDENPRKNTIFLPKNIQKYLESQRKSLGNLYANIFSLDPVKIPEFPFEISLKIKQIFHKNTQIREKSLYLAFLTLPELLDLEKLFMRNLIKQGNLCLFSRGIYQISILDWQIFVKIKKIWNSSFLIEYNNVALELNEENNEISVFLDKISLFSLEKQLPVETNRKFLAYFHENSIFKSNSNIFNGNIKKMSNFLINSWKIPELSPIFSLKKIGIIVKIADNLLTNCFLKSFINEIKTDFNHIYLNFRDLISDFFDEESNSSVEAIDFIEKVVSLMRNNKKTVFFLDFRDFQLSKLKKSLNLLDSLSESSNIQYFLLFPGQNPSKFPSINLDFNDSHLFTIFLQIIAKDLPLIDLQADERDKFFTKLTARLPQESFKNLISLASKFESNLNNFLT